jgi:hypothetical protein
MKNQPIQILVRDSFHTTTIAQSLARFLGDKAVCHENHCPDGTKIDVFVLSGMNILRGEDALALKASIGSGKAKIIATSAIEDILEDIMRDKHVYGVDFAVYKSHLVGGLSLADTGDGEWSAQNVLRKILRIFTANTRVPPPKAAKKTGVRKRKTALRRRIPTKRS